MGAKEEMFTNYVVGKNKCWLWLGYLDAAGYPLIQHTAKHGAIWVSRAFYEKAFGKLDPKVRLGRTCKVRRCVNPLHAKPGTAVHGGS